MSIRKILAAVAVVIAVSTAPVAVHETTTTQHAPTHLAGVSWR